MKKLATNQDGIQTFYRHNTLVFEIDGHKARYKGKKVKDLTAFEKRKFDNLLFLENAHERKRIKTFYH